MSWLRSGLFGFHRRVAEMFARCVRHGCPITYTLRPRGQMPGGGQMARCTPTQMHCLKDEKMQCDQNFGFKVFIKLSTQIQNSVEPAIHTLHKNKNYQVPFARISRFKNSFLLYALRYFQWTSVIYFDLLTFCAVVYMKSVYDSIQPHGCNINKIRLMNYGQKMLKMRYILHDQTSFWCHISCK